MASLSAAGPANLILGFHPRALIPTINAVKLCTRASPASSSLRFEGTTRLQINRRLLTVCAANSNSTVGKSPNEGPGVNETSKSAERPPILTILAGFFLFFIVCWMVGSLVMWLISLIVNVPSPK